MELAQLKIVTNSFNQLHFRCFFGIRMIHEFDEMFKIGTSDVLPDQ